MLCVAPERRELSQHGVILAQALRSVAPRCRAPSIMAVFAFDQQMDTPSCCVRSAPTASRSTSRLIRAPFGPGDLLRYSTDHCVETRDIGSHILTIRRLSFIGTGRGQRVVTARIIHKTN